MTKTLVALYETVTTAAQVVQELIADGFARSDIHLALDHTTSHAAHNATGVQEAIYSLLMMNNGFVCESANGGFDCQATSVMGPASRVFYVSPESVYVWTTDWARDRALPSPAA